MLGLDHSIMPVAPVQRRCICSGKLLVDAGYLGVQPVMFHSMMSQIDSLGFETMEQRDVRGRRSACSRFPQLHRVNSETYVRRLSRN